MRKLLLSLFAINFAIINIYAVEDSVSTQASYGQDVYYSFINGTVKTEARTNWDIAFTTNKMSSSILINDGSGSELYSYPNGDTAAWATVDTTGIKTWTKMYNSEASWEEGAFGNNSLGHPDYGWGIYNMITHNLTGDSLFIVKTVNGIFKKLWIKGKQSLSATYTFRLANLDGSNDTTIVLNALPYSSKFFIYFDANTNQIIDREPDSDAWDILFTKYMAAQPQGGYYSVTGILSNPLTEIAKVDQVDTSIVNWSDYAFSQDRAVIGWDWKAFSMTTFSYTITDSLVNFVKTQNGEIYKMILTGFAGSTTGNYYFTKELLSNTGLEGLDENTRISIYPNPVKDVLTINSQYQINSIELFDLSGRNIYNTIGQGQTANISVSELPTGIYLLKIRQNNKTSVHKFVVQ